MPSPLVWPFGPVGLDSPPGRVGLAGLVFAWGGLLAPSGRVPAGFSAGFGLGEFGSVVPGGCAPEGFEGFPSPGWPGLLPVASRGVGGVEGFVLPVADSGGFEPLRGAESEDFVPSTGFVAFGSGEEFGFRAASGATGWFCCGWGCSPGVRGEALGLLPAG